MDDKNKIVNAELLLQESPGNQENSLSVKDFFYKCLAQWRWFVLSILISMGLATLYILSTLPIYSRSALVMVKEDSKGRSVSSDISSMFADIGLTQVNSNVNNELLAIQTPAAILETIRRLNLDTDYSADGIFHKEPLYGTDLPVNVRMLDLTDDESASFTVRLNADGSMEFDDFRSSVRDIESQIATGIVNDTIATPLGRIVVTPTTSYRLKDRYQVLYVSRTNLFDCTDDIVKRLEVELSSEDATVIKLSYKDVSIARAEDVLNTLISVYNEEWMKDRNQIIVSTSSFITDRLGELERELGDVDNDISSYKSVNLLPDAGKVSDIYLEHAQDARNQILMLCTKISVARYIRDYLTDSKNNNQLLPANSGLDSPGIEAQIAEYNTMQLQRNNLLLNSGENNPLIMDLDQSLAAMRRAIVSSVDNLVVSLDTRKRELERNERNTTSHIAANPGQEKYLQTVGRQQKVKEALYLFLLQKREENELSQAFTAYNIRILTPPMGNLKSVAPRKSLILLLSFCLGFFVPTVVIYIRESMNTAVRGRKDMTKLSIPFIGEIPLSMENRRRYGGILAKIMRLRGKSRQENNHIVVKEGERDIVNEAFRVLRTNLEFMVGKNKEVIILTSLNPGSGKTFLTMNIATSLAIKGKKVLVVDGDMRRASLSAYVGTPNTGLSDYLAGRIIIWRDIARKVDEVYADFDIIPVGTIPPNPTELLFGERLERLISEVRKYYDYVFIDCPPVDIVADTQILEKIADRTLFVVRAGLFDRNMLPELESFYKYNKLRNMAVVLNGTESYAGNYGYRYGYEYGYMHGKTFKK